MKIGPRIPSLRRRIAARTSWKRYVRHSLGFKAPRGMGWLTNPKKAAYNRVYNRATFDPFKPRRHVRGHRTATGGMRITGGRLVALAVVIILLAAILR